MSAEVAAVSPELFSAALSPPPGVPDADLLRRYADTRDEAAFELLVRRHAAAVWRVCRAVASDRHSAEDAFQVTFLTLVRKGHAVRSRLAGWLCRVAHRAALKARRRTPEPLAFDPAFESALPDDTAAAVLAELDRLPDAERVPVLLCHLAGYTQAEAAAELGVPVGTVAARVSRACGKLRDRCARRGIAPALLPLTVGSVAVAEPLIRKTVALANPDAAVAPGLAALSHEVTPPMRLTVPRFVAATVLAGLLVAGAVFVPALADAPKADPPPAAQPQPLPGQPQPLPPEVKARIELAASTLRMKKVAEAYRQYVVATGVEPRDVTDKTGKKLLSWRVHILPYMEQRNLHALINQDKAWDAEENKPFASVAIKLFASPQGGPASGTRIRRIGGQTGPALTFTKPMTFATVSAAAFPCLVETGDLAPWLKPDEDVPFDPNAKAVELPAPHPFGTLVATTDGRVHLIEKKPPADVIVDWVANGAKMKADISKLYPPAGKITDAEKAAADTVTKELDAATEARRKLDERRAELLRKLGEPATTAGDPDPLRLVPRLEEADRLRREQYSAEQEVKRLEEELRKREKK